MPKANRLIGPSLFILCSWAIIAATVRPSDSEDTYRWNLPKGFPRPRVPASNPMTLEKVKLGRHLFYDMRMSVSGTASCATCHKQRLAFTDGRPVGVGATGQHHTRGAMSLVNVAYSSVLNWSNPTLTTLESQALGPMFSEHPVELGLGQSSDFLAKLASDQTYQYLFSVAFPESVTRFSVDNVAKAIASFERSIISARSPFDRYHYGGEDDAVSESAKRGEILFFSQQLSCFRCHGGFNFSDNTTSAGHEMEEPEFHNTGLYNLAGVLSYPAPNTGVFEFTHNPRMLADLKHPPCEILR